MMQLIIAALLLVPQEPPSHDENGLVQLVRLLSADSVDDRLAAEKELESSNVNQIPFLRKQLQGLKDNEPKERLTAIVRHIATREATRLYADSKIPEALEMFAEAEGAPDLKAYVRKRTAEVAEQIAELMPKGNGVGGREEFLNDESYIGIAKKIDSFGPWVISPLLEMLSHNDVRRLSMATNAHTILLKIPNLAVPALCWALKGSDRGLKISVCYLLGEIPSAQYRAQPPIQVIKTLVEVLHNSESDPELKDAARSSLRRLTHREPE